jgi:hypothetical protein
MAAVGELVVLVEGAPSGSMPVHSGDVLTLGRAPDCHVRIRLASVSRLSARLAAEGPHAFLVSASASAPAVLTRGAAAQRVEVPLGVPVCLQHGDRLAFGTRDFLFHYGGCISQPGLCFLCHLPSLPCPLSHARTLHASRCFCFFYCSGGAAGR